VKEDVEKVRYPLAEGSVGCGLAEDLQARYATLAQGSSQAEFGLADEREPY
jgi:hypothetical protein